MASQLKQNTFEPIIKNIGQNNINTVMTGYKVNFGINTNQNNLNKASQFRLNTNQNNVNAFQNNSKSAQVLNNNLEITQSYTQIHQNNMDQVEQLHNYQIYLSQRLGWLTENVYLCKDIQNQQLYACKKIQFESNVDLLKFVHTLSKVVGNYICKLYFTCICKDYLYVITEYCPQDSIQQYINKQKPSLNRIMTIFSQIVQGYYESLYKNEIIHFNLKLENILMKDDIPKIINFAFGKFKSDTSLSIEKAYKYVPNLVAPEVLYKSTYTCSYKADIYSLGVLLYQMTNDLYYPYIFKSQSDIDYFHQYSQKYGIENTLKFKSLTNERVKNLIYQMMQYYEDDRISIQELVIQTQQIAYNQQEILFNLW